MSSLKGYRRHNQAGRKSCDLRRARVAKRQFQFHKRRYLFIRTHNETLSVVAVCVCNPDRSPVGINR